MCPFHVGQNPDLDSIGQTPSVKCRPRKPNVDKAAIRRLRSSRDAHRHAEAAGVFVRIPISAVLFPPCQGAIWGFTANMGVCNSSAWMWVFQQ
jgi:hypothetical protein